MGPETAPGAPSVPESTDSAQSDRCLENGTTEPGESSENKHESLPYNWAKPDVTVEPISFKELFKRNWHPTLVYCGVFWSFGMCVAFLGPTLLDLGCQTSSDMKRISWVFFFQLFCTLIGSVIAGFLVQRSNANVVILVSCIFIPFFIFLIPFCKVLASLAVVLCLMGLNMGAIDCLANVQMIKLYGDAVSPFLQAMHFCYGFGAFVSPLIAEPFLLNKDCSEFIDNPKDSLIMKHSHNETHMISKLDVAQHETRVRFSFWIMAALQIPVPILVASLLYRVKMFGFKLNDETQTQVNGAAPKPKYGTISKEKGDTNKPFWPQDQYKHHNVYKLCGTARSQIITITIFTAILLFIFDGLQSEYGGFIYSYAVKSIAGLNKTEGAYLNAVYWGTFALGRLISIPVATVVSSAFMLFCNIIGCLIAMILMLCLRHDHIALYIGTCLFGLFLSSATPTTLSLTEQYIDITSTITTIVVVAAALGDMVSPVIVAHLFVDIGPWSFLQFGLAFSIFSLFMYVLLLLSGSQTPKHAARGSTSSFVWFNLCCVRSMEAPDEPTTHVKYYTRMSESDSTIELGTANGDASAPREQ